MSLKGRFTAMLSPGGPLGPWGEVTAGILENSFYLNPTSMSGFPPGEEISSCFFCVLTPSWSTGSTHQYQLFTCRHVKLRQPVKSLTTYMRILRSSVLLTESSVNFCPRKQNPSALFTDGQYMMEFRANVSLSLPMLCVGSGSQSQLFITASI